MRATATAIAWLAGAPRSSRSSEPSAPQTALSIHRETRNTRAGALGVRLWSLGFRPSRAKRYRGASRLSLPAAASRKGLPLEQVARGWKPETSVGGSLTFAELSRLLRYTNGVTGRWGNVPLRAAPSAGALYAGEVYAVAAGVRGLAPGAYYYRVARHRLESVGPGDLTPRIAAALEGPASVGAPVFFLLSNVFQRYTHRYRNRGYRYALIDTGHIGENLRLAAASAGLAALPVLRFHDDALHEALELDGREEAICAVYAVGRAQAAPGDTPSRALAERQTVEPALTLSGSPPERYHAATKLVPAARAFEAAPLPGSRFRGETVPLPQRAPVATSVEHAVRMRRSAEAFREEPMTLADLGLVLALAGGNPALALAPGVEIRVVAHRVTGLARGVYRFERQRGLRRLRPGSFVDKLADVCLGQERAATAAAGIVMLAPVTAAAATRGERSYRDLLIESGAIAQRIYLAAEAVGLAARNLAAFLDDELDEMLGADVDGHVAVHLTMIGPGD